MTCNDCIHEAICDMPIITDGRKNASNCGKFKNKADFVEVKHGEWIYEPSSDTLGGTDATYDWICSVCKGTSVDDTKFCPNCGAKMKGGKGE